MVDQLFIRNISHALSSGLPVGNPLLISAIAVLPGDGSSLTKPQTLVFWSINQVTAH